MELSEWTVALLFICITAIVYWFKKRNASRTFSCPNPDCARCTIMREFEQTRSMLKNKLSELLRDQPETSSWLSRIHLMLNTPNDNNVWCLEGLDTPPFINQYTSNAELSNLHRILSSHFLSNSNLKFLLLDYQRAVQATGKWKTNNTPTGNWKVFHLMDQGVWQKDRTIFCPNTMQVLDSITTHLMTGNLYGNVMISVLELGSSIEPHTGPCNFRIRCHIPIQPSSGFSIRVHTEVHTWEQGKLLLFTDHHEHEVWHSTQDSAPVSLPRVVLIFDIWHPSIKSEEKNVLNHLFHELVT